MKTANQLALEQLIRARARLTPRKAWTKEEFARDKHRMPVNSGSPEAVCWCSVGALNAARDDIYREYGPSSGFGLGDQRARNLLRTAMRQPIAQFNDESITTHEDVLSAFDRAIEMAKGTS